MRISDYIIAYFIVIVATIASCNAKFYPSNSFGSLKERFRRAVVASRPLNRARRTAHFDVRFPQGTNLQVWLVINLPMETEAKYSGSKFQTGIVAVRPLPSYMVDATANPTLDQVLGVDQRRKRDIEERKSIYDEIATSLDDKGLPGKSCLLRTICELTDAPMQFGIFGDFMNLLFSPSLLADEAEDSEVEELRDFLKAEEKGRLQGECHKTFSECPQSMFELLPFVNHKIFHI